MNRLAAFISTGLLGAATLMVGLVWDSYLHAQDPTLAHREGLFTLSNPGHLLLGLGIGLVVVGLVGSAYVVLPLGTWMRRGFLAGALAMIMAAGATVGWAASVERAAQHPGALAADVHGAAPARPLTAKQLEAAMRLLVETKAAVAKYADQQVAVADGYGPGTPPELPIVHFLHPTYVFDADILRPEHVESLIYFNSERGPVLIGAMYMMPLPYVAGPQIGGSLTTWHHHEDLCGERTMIVAQVGRGPVVVPGLPRVAACPEGSQLQVTPDMLHVWIVDNPKGPFDTDMDLASLRAIASARALH
jgi:hypothetical protein